MLRVRSEVTQAFTLRILQSTKIPTYQCWQKKTWKKKKPKNVKEEKKKKTPPLCSLIICECAVPRFLSDLGPSKIENYSCYDLPQTWEERRSVDIWGGLDSSDNRKLCCFTAASITIIYWLYASYKGGTEIYSPEQTRKHLYLRLWALSKLKRPNTGHSTKAVKLYCFL